MTEFLPEGRRLAYKENTAALQSSKTLMQAAVSGAILEASCTVCDAEHNMHVDLGCMKGIIPRSEGAIGIESGATRDIALISRVGKPVCFKITKIDETGSEPLAILSRKAAQEEADKEYVSKLTPGDIIGARVTHLEQFGCFVDIGCGIASMIPIDAISVSRIVHPANRFSVGDDIFAVVKGRDQGHICLTHKELLGTWQENAARFRAGQTVTGIACGKTDYGVFIALTPNLCGLAERDDTLEPGQPVCVYIKAIHPETLKLKLTVLHRLDTVPPQPLRFTKTEGRLDVWRYGSRENAKIVTVF